MPYFKLEKKKKNIGGFCENKEIIHLQYDHRFVTFLPSPPLCPPPLQRKKSEINSNTNTNNNNKKKNKNQKQELYNSN